jgi:hypothetical protein
MAINHAKIARETGVPRKAPTEKERSRNHSLALERNIRTRKIGRKGEVGRRVLENGYHVTKGFRLSSS